MSSIQYFFIKLKRG